MSSDKTPKDRQTLDTLESLAAEIASARYECEMRLGRLLGLVRYHIRAERKRLGLKGKS